MPGRIRSSPPGRPSSPWRCALAGDHLSLYQLTIEPGTRFGELAARGRLRGLPGADLAAAMFVATEEVCAAAGLPAYEVSNHARPGAESRHNLVYWRYGDYVGIGPGAHGRLTQDGVRRATEAIRAPEAWLAAVERTGSGSADARAAVARRAGGGDADDGPAARRRRRSAPLRRARRAAARRPARSSELAALGLIVVRPDRLRATADGSAVFWTRC